MLRNQLADLEHGCAHPDTEQLGLIGTGNDTAIVIRKDHHWAFPQAGLEQPLTGCIEVVAVDQRKGGHQRPQWRRMLVVTTPQISQSFSPIGNEG